MPLSSHLAKQPLLLLVTSVFFSFLPSCAPVVTTSFVVVKFLSVMPFPWLGKSRISPLLPFFYLFKRGLIIGRAVFSSSDFPLLFPDGRILAGA